MRGKPGSEPYFLKFKKKVQQRRQSGAIPLALQMMASEPKSKRPERPYAFAILCVLIAFVVSGALIAWGWNSPEMVLVGKQGKHDPAIGQTQRLAGCLDCHVPFIGTPGSRCLSPSCHGALATGTPPRDGPAMPVRFHAALANIECNHCHVEHGEARRAKSSAFNHSIIPESGRTQCSRCHSGARQSSHSQTDAIECSLCHDIDQWPTENIDHRRVWTHACDVCHVAPTTQAHASVAGTCSTCHETTSWRATEAKK